MCYFTDAPYDIQLDGSDKMTAVAGVDRITIHCSAICNPSCSYQWKKIGGPNMSNNNTLDLNPVQKEHHGSYQCVALNKHTTTGQSRQVTLTVNCKYIKLYVVLLTLCVLALSIT